MAKAERTGDVITILPSAREVHLLTANGSAQLPGVRYHVRADAHHDGDHFVMPLTWASCVALRGAFGAALEVGDELNEWAHAELSRRVIPATAVRAMHLELDDDHPLKRELHSDLYPFQMVGAAFLAAAGSAVLADDMGVGKTPQAISALRLLDARPALIVAPNSTKRAWARQFEKWWPEARVAVVSGTPKQRRAAIESIAERDCDVLIINWEAVRSFSKVAAWGSAVRPDPKEKEPKELNAIEWKAVVADEAHRAKEPKAKQTRALWAVAAGAPHRFALTGTPVLNTPEDAWSLGHFVAPDEWPGKTAFIDRYAFKTFNPWGGMEVVGLRPENEGELFKFLDPRLLRRTMPEVMPWMPEKVYSRRDAELTPKQRRAYNAMEDEMMAAIDGGSTAATSPLTQLMRLRQFASAYAEIDEDGKLRLAEPSCKVDALEDIADELRGKRAVVFAESAQLIRLAGARLEKRGYSIAYMDGATSTDERDAAVRDFQSGDAQFVLATLGAGGEGVDGLQVADTAIFLQRSYSRAAQLQAEGRVYRHGQEGESVHIIDVVSAGTIEDRVLEALDDKADIAEQITRDKLRELMQG